MRVSDEFELTTDTVAAHYKRGKDKVYVRQLRFGDRWSYPRGDMGVDLTSAQLRKMAQDLTDIAGFIDQHAGDRQDDEGRNSTSQGNESN